MAVSYVAEFCPQCQKVTVFERFESYTGSIRTCKEKDCGFYEVVRDMDDKDYRRDNDKK